MRPPAAARIDYPGRRLTLKRCLSSRQRVASRTCTTGSGAQKLGMRRTRPRSGPQGRSTSPHEEHQRRPATPCRLRSLLLVPIPNDALVRPVGQAPVTASVTCAAPASPTHLPDRTEAPGKGQPCLKDLPPRPLRRLEQRAAGGPPPSQAADLSLRYPSRM